MRDGDHLEIETLGSRIAYETRWLKIREDRIRYADGTQSTYSVLEKPDFVAVIAVDDDKNIHLVEQYRYPLGRRTLELPMGSWEGGDAALIDVAHGELREETGLTAGRMVSIGRLLSAPALTAQGFEIFIATDLTASAQSLELEEQGLVARAYTLAEIEARIKSGDIQDTYTIAALGLAKLHGAI